MPIQNATSKLQIMVHNPHRVQVLYAQDEEEEERVKAEKEREWEQPYQWRIIYRPTWCAPENGFLSVAIRSSFLLRIMTSDHL